MPALDPDLVAALVPCHREPPARDLLERIAAQVGRVLVIDDGMPAQQGLALDRLASALGVETLHLHASRGKGHAIAAGIRATLVAPTRSPGVLVIDADGQHPPEAIPAFLAASAAAELIVGNRLADGGRSMPLVRHLANRISSRLVSLTTRSSVPDSQCGMRLLRGRALRLVQFPGGRMDSETRHLKDCLRAGVPVAWVSIPAIYEGQPSSFRPVFDSIAVLHAAVARPVGATGFPAFGSWRIRSQLDSGSPLGGGPSPCAPLEPAAAVTPAGDPVGAAALAASTDAGPV